MTAVRPVAERTLEVDYLGHAECQRAVCPGAAHNDPMTNADLEKVLVGRVPFVLERDERRLLVFALRVTPAGLSTFGQRCLHFDSVELTLRDGSRHVARFGRSGIVTGVQLKRPPPDYAACP